MQTITEDLRAILKSHFAAGADGFRARLEITESSYRVIRASPSKSLTTDADRLEVDIDNSDGLITPGLISPDTPAKLFAWYGDIANQLQVFAGLIDRIQVHRSPSNIVTISLRDWMKKLIVQKILVTDPQSADDPLAVRTTANFVYLGMLVEDIVTDLLAKAGNPFPGGMTVEATGITVDEFLGNNDEPFAAAISRLADMPGFHSFADEFGAYFFKFLRAYDNGTYDYTYATGVDVLLLAAEASDDQTYTRVRVTGPMTTTATVDSWSEEWVTTGITHPVGAWYDPTDSANVRIVDSHTKRIYLLRQSDRVILSSVYIGGSVTYPLALSGDPGDATHYWVLDAPWAFTGGVTSGIRSGNRLHKFLKADNSLVASYALPDGRWSDVKVSAAFIWLTDFDTDQFWQFDRTVVTPNAGYSLGFLNPTGLAIDGTSLEIFYEAGKSYVVDESAPTVIVRTISSAPSMWGGEYDTTTHTELFVVGSGQVWKYTTATSSETSTEVFSESVDATLEAQLLALTDFQEVRRLVVPLPAILSQAFAALTADQILNSVDKFSDTIDVGIIGNPALQKGDIIKLVDPVLALGSGDRGWQLITYHSELAGDSGTYLGTLSLKRLKPE